MLWCGLTEVHFHCCLTSLAGTGGMLGGSRGECPWLWGELGKNGGNSLQLCLCWVSQGRQHYLLIRNDESCDYLKKFVKKQAFFFLSLVDQRDDRYSLMTPRAGSSVHRGCVSEIKETIASAEMVKVLVYFISPIWENSWNVCKNWCYMDLTFSISSRFWHLRLRGLRTQISDSWKIFRIKFRGSNFLFIFLLMGSSVNFDVNLLCLDPDGM